MAHRGITSQTHAARSCPVSRSPTAAELAAIERMRADFEGYKRLALAIVANGVTARDHDFLRGKWCARLLELTDMPMTGEQISEQLLNGNPREISRECGSYAQARYGERKAPRSWRKGARVGNGQKLNTDDVRAIRQAREDGARVADLAAQYGVTHTTIYDICNRRVWEWLE